MGQRIAVELAKKPARRRGLGIQSCVVYPSRMSFALRAAMQRAIAGVGAWQ